MLLSMTLLECPASSKSENFLLTCIFQHNTCRAALHHWGQDDLLSAQLTTSVSQACLGQSAFARICIRSAVCCFTCQLLEACFATSSSTSSHVVMQPTYTSNAHAQHAVRVHRLHARHGRTARRGGMARSKRNFRGPPTGSRPARACSASIPRPRGPAGRMPTGRTEPAQHSSI